MYDSPKNKKRDLVRRIRQKSKNGASPRVKRQLKKRSARIMRRNIRREMKGHSSTPPTLSPSPPPPPPSPMLRRQNAVCHHRQNAAWHDSDEDALVAWARNLPFQSALKHNWATDIQMAWRKKMLSKRIKSRANLNHLRRDINSILQTICELREFTNSSYVHLIDCSPLTTTLEFLYDRLCEISKLHYTDMPTPASRGGEYEEWYHLNGTIDRAHVLLEKVTDRILSVINTRSGSTTKTRTLLKVVRSGRFGLRFADILSMQPTSSRDCEEEAWGNFMNLS